MGGLIKGLAVALAVRQALVVLSRSWEEDVGGGTFFGGECGSGVLGGVFLVSEVFLRERTSGVFVFVVIVILEGPAMFPDTLFSTDGGVFSCLSFIVYQK